VYCNTHAVTAQLPPAHRFDATAPPEYESDGLGFACPADAACGRPAGS